MLLNYDKIDSFTSSPRRSEEERIPLFTLSSPTKQWLKRRKLTLIGFCIQNLLIGVEYSLTFFTLWLYLRDMVKPDQPKLVYGLISSSYLVASVICSFTVGSYVDRTRNNRRMCFLGNALVVVGNVMYTVQFSSAFLVVGRLMAGMVGPMRSIAIAELARVYKEDELSAKISLVGMCYSLGFLVGPLINFAFRNIDIEFYGWHITYVNVPGLYAAFMFSIMLVVTYFMIFDLSKVFDMKRARFLEQMQHENNNSKTNGHTTESTFHPCTNEGKTIPKEKTESESDKSWRQVLAKLMSNFDVVAILLIAFFSNYLMVSVDMWLPMLLVDVMLWTINEINMVVAGTGLSSIALMLLVIYKKPSNGQLYCSAMTSTLVYVFIQIIFIVLKASHGSQMFNIALCVGFSVGYAFASLIEDVFLVSTLAKLVSSEMQTLTDTLRMSALRMGGLMGLLISPLIFDYMTTVGVAHIAVILCGAAVLFCRRNTFMYPKVQVK